MNHIMSRSDRQSAPKVGDGATILMWTDRHAGTVVKVTPTQIHVRRDFAKRIDCNGMSESQNYEYTENVDGPMYVFRLTKKGYRCLGCGLMIGSRSEYHDYSF